VDTDRIQEGCAPWRAAGEGDRARTGVVLTHGLTGNPQATTPLAERLHAAGHGVDVVRLPGHGSTVRDMARTRYDDWRGAVEEALDRTAAACDRVVLVGHSMGGTLSLDVASARPDDVAGVVAINAIVLSPTELLARLAPVLQYVLPFVPRESAGLPTNDIARPDVAEGAYAWVPLIRQLPRVRAQLLDLVQSLLIVTSPQDHTVDPANGDAIAELVGSGDVQRLTAPRSYHIPQLDWDRDLVESSIVAFVERVHAGAPAV
jgi:carboxylesterase